MESLRINVTLEAYVENWNCNENSLKIEESHWGGICADGANHNKNDYISSNNNNNNNNDNNKNNNQNDSDNKNDSQNDNNNNNNNNDSNNCNEAPLYVDFMYNKNATDIHGNYGVNEFAIKYVFFYPYNGPTFFLPFLNIGAHYLDIERITVHVNTEDGSITKVCMYACIYVHNIT